MNDLWKYELVSFENIMMTIGTIHYEWTHKASNKAWLNLNLKHMHYIVCVCVSVYKRERQRFEM